MLAGIATDTGYRSKHRGEAHAACCESRVHHSRVVSQRLQASVCVCKYTSERTTSIAMFHLHFIAETFCVLGWRVGRAVSSFSSTCFSALSVEFLLFLGGFDAKSLQLDDSVVSSVDQFFFLANQWLLLRWSSRAARTSTSGSWHRCRSFHCAPCSPFCFTAFVQVCMSRGTRDGPSG